MTRNADTATFSAREIRYLQSLPAVERVAQNRIHYTEEFKRDCIRQYEAGESPAQIFRRAGLDSSLIGYKRIERCIARWRRYFKTEKPDGAVRRQGVDAADARGGIEPVGAAADGVGSGVPAEVGRGGNGGAGHVGEPDGELDGEVRKRERADGQGGAAPERDGAAGGAMDGDVTGAVTGVVNGLAGDAESGNAADPDWHVESSGRGQAPGHGGVINRDRAGARGRTAGAGRTGSRGDRGDHGGRDGHRAESAGDARIGRFDVPESQRWTQPVTPPVGHARKDDDELTSVELSARYEPAAPERGRGRGDADIYGLIIMQQARRIDQLERQLERLRDEMRRGATAR